MTEELHELITAHISSIQQYIDSELVSSQVGDVNLALMYREQTVLHIEQMLKALQILGDVGNEEI